MGAPESEIAAFVLSRPPVDGVRLVGVDGPSGAGKSTIARRLSPLLDAPIVELDDFVSWDCFAGWWPRFEAQVWSPLRHGSDAVYQARDWTDWYGSSLGPWKTVPWHPIVIVEGVTATRRATVGRLAGAIWVDAPAELRLSRGLTRDAAFPGAPALWARWMAEENRFFTADDTRARADFVIDTADGGRCRAGRDRPDPLISRGEAVPVTTLDPTTALIVGETGTTDDILALL